MKKIIKIGLFITIFLSSICLIPNIKAAAPHGLDFSVKKGELCYEFEFKKEKINE